MGSPEARADRLYFMDPCTFLSDDTTHCFTKQKSNPSHFFFFPTPVSCFVAIISIKPDLEDLDFCQGGSASAHL